MTAMPSSSASASGLDARGCDSDPAQLLRDLVRASLGIVEANRNQLNALNVFPVPDGDTGTNMLLTLRHIDEQLSAKRTAQFADAVEDMARAALLGARGNSGLILAQLFRGLRTALQDEAELTAANFAAALGAATDLAYQAVPQPREGTMLTVIRESADAARAAIAAGDAESPDLAELVGSVAEEALRSVERTPELLDVLKRAGVVDSGGWGLAMMFESMHHYLNGEGEFKRHLDPPMSGDIPAVAEIAVDRNFVESVEDEEWGYCTVFAVEGAQLDIDAVRAEMAPIGRSPVISGDDTLIKVHLHTEDPGMALTAAVKHGALSNIDINNMDAQATEWAAERRKGMVGDPPPPPRIDLGVLAVVAGEGISAYFHSVAPGAVTIVEGGDSLNPSVEEILDGIAAVPSDNVIVLPNNRNIVGAAQQAAELSEKTVMVVDTTSMQAGIAAIGAFNPHAPIDENAEEMADMLTELHVGSVFKSVRDADVNGVQVKQGQYLCTVDGDAIGASDDEVELLLQGIMSSMHHGASVFVFVGDDEDPRRAADAHARIQRATSKFRRVDVDFIDGGQPHYNYLFSIE